MKGRTEDEARTDLFPQANIVKLTLPAIHDSIGKFCSDIGTSQASRLKETSKGRGPTLRTQKLALSLCLMMRDDA